MFHSANCWRKRPVRAKQPRQQDSSSDHQAAPAQGKGLGLDQSRGVLGLAHAARLCSSPTREGGQDNCIQGTVKASTAEPSGTN